MCPPLQLLSSHDSLGCQDFVSRDSYPKLVPRVIRVSQKAKLSYEQFQNAIFGDLEYVRILQYYLQLTRGISSRDGGGGGQGGKGGGGNTIYFLYKGRSDTVRVSFSGFSVFRYTISHFRVLNRVVPVNLLLFSPFDHYHVRLFRVQTYVPFLVFWIRPDWSSLEQGKKLQHFLLDRVANFHLLCLEQGQGFVESAKLPYPNSCWIHPPPRDICRIQGVQNFALVLSVAIKPHLWP